MKQLLLKKSALALAIGAASFSTIVLNGCKDDKDEKVEIKQIELKNQSVTPSLVRALPGFESLQIFPLISSDDQLPESPNFVFGAQPDGAGILKDPNSDGYVMINNHEILFSVSRVYLDKNLKPIKGEYIVDAAGGKMRLCSATMATPQEHGFGPVFLTAGETSVESMIHAIDPLGFANKKADRTLKALGKCNAENAVPLPKTAYPGKTAIFIGEDESNTANSLGQVNLYLSNTVGDLDNGKLHMLRRTNLNVVETDMAVGQTYDVEFVEYDNVSTKTGLELQAQTITKSAIQFARVEDLDYGKGSAEANRILYFTATGVSGDLINPRPGVTMWGRIYKLELDATNPLKGKLTPLIDGVEDPGNSIVNPDNICVTKNFVYIQEDGDSFYVNNKHDGRIWQYNIATKVMKPMLEMHHRRGDAAFAKYNQGSNKDKLSSWEYGAMYDISDLIGKPNTFVVNIHPHTWTEAKFGNADGSGLTTNTEGGQTIIITGIDK